MKKIISIALVSASLLSADIFAQTVTLPQDTEWHTVGRMRAVSGGSTYVWTAAPEVMWMGSGNGSEESCVGRSIFISPSNFPTNSSTGEKEGFQNILTQLYLAAGTGREVRFLGVTCDVRSDGPNNGSMRPSDIETR